MTDGAGADPDAVGPLDDDVIAPAGEEADPTDVDVDPLAPEVLEADAGEDVDALGGETIDLDGSKSRSSRVGVELGFSWRQVGGAPVVLLEDAQSATPRFTAPLVESGARLVFRLTVQGATGSASDDVAVLVEAATSSASWELMSVSAGPDRDAMSADVVVLTALVADVPPDSVVQFSWIQTAGSHVTLSNTDQQTVMFVAPASTEAEVFIFEVMAEGSGMSVADVVVITVLPAPSPSPLPIPAPSPPPPPSGCLSAADCDDGIFCNGTESCLNGSCVPGIPSCAGSICDEASRACVECQTSDDCQDGQFCNGQEVCSAGACAAGIPPCAGLRCNESTRACVQCLDASDCDDSLFCNGQEQCVTGFCQPGSTPCSSGICEELGMRCLDSLCAGGTPPFQSPIQAGSLLGTVADEASGLVASRRNSEVLWTHNDDTGDNRVFAIQTNGTLLGTFTMGSGAVDPEDIAIGPGPVAGVDYLYWGHIGDNNNVRSTIFVLRAIEPTVVAGQNPVQITLSGVETLSFAYPAGPAAPSHKDAETLLVDPWNGDIYVVTKRTGVGMVYRATYPQSTSSVTTLEYIASLPWSGAVGGDISPDGQQILIRRYSGNVPAASNWTRPAGTTIASAFSNPRCDVGLASEPQGEAICWDRWGQGYYTVSENQTPGAVIPIWYFARTGN